MAGLPLTRDTRLGWRENIFQVAQARRQNHVGWAREPTVMGLNIVIGCHRCRERVWMFRGEEGVPIQSFYRAHWLHSDAIAISDDQSNLPWAWDDDGYREVGAEHGVKQFTDAIVGGTTARTVRAAGFSPPEGTDG